MKIHIDKDGNIDSIEGRVDKEALEYLLKKFNDITSRMKPCTLTIEPFTEKGPVVIIPVKPKKP